MIAALLCVVGSFPLFLVIAGIMFVYFVLVFQVFTFEPDKSPVECYKRSFDIIKGNFAKTLSMILILGALTYWLLPEMVNAVFEILNLVTFFGVLISGWVAQLPINELNELLLQTPFAYQLDVVMVSEFIVSSMLLYCLICFTLPLRTICWALWYKSLAKPEKKLDKKILDRAEGKD